MNQSPFFYYQPEATDQRHHGHFSPDPSSIATGNQYQRFQQQQMYPSEMLMQPQLMPLQSMPCMSSPQSYIRPHVAFPQQLQSTPMSSPRPMFQKSSYTFQQNGQPLALDTDCANSSDPYNMYPATPPLSVSGSLNSPPMSCGVLPTPTNGNFYGLENIEGVKEGCEGDVHSEILAGGDWTRCGTPPLTPGTLFLFFFIDLRIIKIII